MHSDIIVRAGILFAAYLLGGVSAGYWLVRWRIGRDVRAEGSGSTGATNVGRVLGPGGFIVVLLLDASKGALAVLGAQALAGADSWPSLAAVCVVAGHVWPPQLGFRGGKGIASLLGAWLALIPFALVPCLLLAVATFWFLRDFVRAGLTGLAVLPLAVYSIHNDIEGAIAALLAVSVVQYAHRTHWQRQGRKTP